MNGLYGMLKTWIWQGRFEVFVEDGQGLFQRLSPEQNCIPVLLVVIPSRVASRVGTGA